MHERQYHGSECRWLSLCFLPCGYSTVREKETRTVYICVYLGAINMHRREVDSMCRGRLLWKRERNIWWSKGAKELVTARKYIYAGRSRTCTPTRIVPFTIPWKFSRYSIGLHALLRRNCELTEEKDILDVNDLFSHRSGASIKIIDLRIKLF